MINLLPKAQQKEIRAARSNTLLLRYVILSAGALLFLLAALLVTYITLNREMSRAETTRQENEQKATSYSDVQTAATQLRTDLTSAKTLFDSEVRYSKVLTRFSALLPKGSAIDSLEFDQKSLTEPVDLRIKISDRKSAEALEENFNNSPFIKNVSLNSVSTNNQSSRYPYVAEVQLSFDGSIAQ